ncbi:MAG: threonylcarbamoyl-AMP synthase [Gammaproteobacteria bacterium]|nr:threonylcarbamoyl-AMP synthase [Gammaproteobacteria bacterium]
MNYKNIIKEACHIILNGGVIAYPTETVYGLGCDPKQDSAIEKLLSLKQRPGNKGLIIIAHELAQFKDFIQPLSSQQQRTIQSATQATTWIVPALPHLSELLCGKHLSDDKKIAIRTSSHPIIQSICNALQQPITSTSANISGQATCGNVKEIHKQFNNLLDYIIDGEVNENSKPSQIIDLLTGEIIRQ